MNARWNAAMNANGHGARPQGCRSRPEDAEQERHEGNEDGERGRKGEMTIRNLVHLHTPFSSVPLPLACPIPRGYVRTRRPARGITTGRLEIILPFLGTTRSHADDPRPRLYKP